MICASSTAAFHALELHLRDAIVAGSRTRLAINTLMSCGTWTLIFILVQWYLATIKMRGDQILKMAGRFTDPGDLIRASTEYLKKYPDEQQYSFSSNRKTVRKAPLVRPRNTRQTTHSVERGNQRKINQNTINKVIRYGNALQVRDRYQVKNKNDTPLWKTNLGLVAPKTFHNKGQCPKRRFKLQIDGKTVIVVLGFCYPEAQTNPQNSRQARWWPNVVTVIQTAIPKPAAIRRNHAPGDRALRQIQTPPHNNRRRQW